MRFRSGQLPSRFPVGTRYVVEGRRLLRGGLRVRSRYVEFPDGKHIDLPIYARDRTNPARRRGRRGARK